MIRGLFILFVVGCFGISKPASAQEARDARLDSILTMDNSAISATYCNLDTLSNTVDLTLDFHFSDKALKILTDEILKDSTLVKSPDSVQIDCEREAKFTFKKVKLVWDKGYNRYVSEGPLRLLKINDAVVSRDIDGFVSFRIKKGGYSDVHLYFHKVSGNYYYFNYQRGWMQSISENDAFNQRIIKTADRKRKMKSEGVGYYIYNIGSGAKKTKAVYSVGDRFR